jgi:hypothetical protein
MEPIFDKAGNAVGWMAPGDAVAGFDGHYRAFVSGGIVFDLRSHYLGRLHNCYFWDRDGYAVAYVAGASGGPAMPEAVNVIPPPPAAREPAMPSPPAVSGPEPAYADHWSDLSWDDFLGGRHKLIAYSK